MLKSFFHSGFIVRDVDRAVEFYTNVLGLKVAMRMERQGEFIDQVLGFSGRTSRAHLWTWERDISWS